MSGYDALLADGALQMAAATRLEVVAAGRADGRGLIPTVITRPTRAEWAFETHEDSCCLGDHYLTRDYGQLIRHQ
ncbi:MAG: hypothetical protein K2X00_09810 [Nitrospiraceae bacterium]|nr:hypothetical protein [Nitrospiraceae bacterium]